MEIIRILLRKNFKPNGERVNLSNLKEPIFHRISGGEIYQCCRKIGRDSQNNFLFCGDIAEYITAVEGGIVALCEGHKPPKSLIIKGYHFPLQIQNHPQIFNQILSQ